MGHSVGLPNRASTGGWGTARTVGAAAHRLGGGGGSGGGEATRGTRKGLALLPVSWSGRGLAIRGDLAHLPPAGDQGPGAVGRPSPIVRSRLQKKWAQRPRMGSPLEWDHP